MSKIIINEAEVESRAKAIAVNKDLKKQDKEPKPKKPQIKHYNQKTRIDGAVKFAAKLLRSEDEFLNKISNLAKRQGMEADLINKDFFTKTLPELGNKTFLEFYREELGGSSGLNYYGVEGKNLVQIQTNTGKNLFVNSDQFIEFIRICNVLTDIAGLTLYDPTLQEPPKKEQNKDQVSVEMEQFQQIYNRAVQITLKVINDLEKYLSKYKTKFDNEGVTAYSNNIANLINILEFIKSGLVAKFIDKNSSADVESLSNELSKVVSQISGAANEVIKNSSFGELQNNDEEPEDLTSDATEMSSPPATPRQQSAEVPRQQSAEVPQQQSAEVPQQQSAEVPRQQSVEVPQQQSVEATPQQELEVNSEVMKQFLSMKNSINDNNFHQIVESIFNILSNESGEEFENIKEDISKNSRTILTMLDEYIQRSLQPRKEPLNEAVSYEKFAERFINRKNQVLKILEYVDKETLEFMRENAGLSINKFFNFPKGNKAEGGETGGYSIFNSYVSKLTEETRNKLININNILDNNYEKLLTSDKEASQENIIQEFIRRTLKSLL